MLRFLLSMTAVVLGLGCGPTLDTLPDVTPDAGPDAVAATNVLEVEGPDRLALVFGEEAVVGVRYLGPSREPLAEQVVSFAFDGRAHDSSLRAVDVQTDATGFARTTLVAGSTPAAFRVRFSAEGAEPAFVEVSVSDEGFGQLAVDVAHEGTREVTALGVAVFAGLTCQDEATLTELGDRYRGRGDESSEVVFAGLPAGLDYAVVGRGEGPSGDLLAWGCIDGVTIEAAGRATVAVVAEDLPQRGRGSYRTTLAIEPSETAARLTTLITEAADGFSSDGTLILDTVERTLRTAGDVEALASLADARARSDADATLDDLLASAGVGPSVALGGLRALVQDRIRRVELSGSLRVADAITLRVSRLAMGTAGDLDELEAFTVGGIPTEVVGTLDARSENLTVEQLSIDLRASTLVAGVAAISGPAGTSEMSPLEAMLSDLARCDAMPELMDIARICDATCLATACAEALKFVTMDLELRLEALDRERSRLVSRGDVALVDDSADLEVDRIEGLLDSVWTGDPSSELERFQIEVSGERVTPPS